MNTLWIVHIKWSIKQRNFYNLLASYTSLDNNYHQNSFMNIVWPRDVDSGWKPAAVAMVSKNSFENLCRHYTKWALLVGMHQITMLLGVAFVETQILCKLMQFENVFKNEAAAAAPPWTSLLWSQKMDIFFSFYCSSFVTYHYWPQQKNVIFPQIENTNVR